MGKRKYTVRHNVKSQYDKPDTYSVYESLDHYIQVIVYNHPDYYWVKIRYHMNNPKYGKTEMNLSWERMETLGAIIGAIKRKFSDRPLKPADGQPLPHSVELKI